MATTLSDVNDIADQLMLVLTDYFITNGTSNLTELLKYRTFIPDLPRYGTVAITGHHIEGQLIELRFMIVLIFAHDGTEAGKILADADLKSAMTDFNQLIADVQHDKATAFSAATQPNLLRTIKQVAVSRVPPAPKYNPDLYWDYLPIQVYAPLWAS